LRERTEYPSERSQSELLAWCATDAFHSLLCQCTVLIYVSLYTRALLFETYIFAEVECPRVLWQVWQKEESGDTDRCADDAIHDLGHVNLVRLRQTYEEPLPSSKAMNTIKTLVHCSLKVTREHCSHCGGCVEDTGSFAKLARLVPSPKDRVSSWIKD
jgi:hypothetical protein